jgi:hypothetical protein
MLAAKGRDQPVLDAMPPGVFLVLSRGLGMIVCGVASRALAIGVIMALIRDVDPTHGPNRRITGAIMSGDGAGSPRGGAEDDNQGKRPQQTGGKRIAWHARSSPSL